MLGGEGRYLGFCNQLGVGQLAVLPAQSLQLHKVGCRTRHLRKADSASHTDAAAHIYMSRKNAAFWPLALFPAVL